MLKKLIFKEGLEPKVTIEKGEDGVIGAFFEGNPLAYFLEITDGVYETSSLNPNLVMDAVTDFEVIREKQYEPIVVTEERYVAAYGVCDNHEQVLALAPEILSRDNEYVIFLTCIQKKHEPERDGWRWSKWGEYIGTQISQADYLYDEPEIEEVFFYRIYEVKTKG